MSIPHVVIVGGGISGLAAAWFLTRDQRATVTLLEAGEEFGGKLRVKEVSGVGVDVGAEAMLATRPEAVNLCRELGIEVIPAATTTAALYSRG